VALSQRYIPYLKLLCIILRVILEETDQPLAASGSIDFPAEERGPDCQESLSPSKDGVLGAPPLLSYNNLRSATFSLHPPQGLQTVASIPSIRTHCPRT
jgi:hypothetical protein